ncbi:MAG: MarR family transcriptional regulator [Kitasatospora sp.]|nr:MarR family transcriptional regulator [Kitasatospora sp.]
MDVADGDAELGRLLVQLLRAVTPVLSDDGEAPTVAEGLADAGASTPQPSVSASEGRALVELLAAHGIAQGELARLLGLEKSTVSRLAGGLEQKGWIRRGRDEGNQRYVRLYLTPAGSVIATRLLQAWQSRQARIIASLTDAERAGLAIGLGGLLRGLVAEGILGDAAAGARGGRDAAAGARGGSTEPPPSAPASR